MTAEPSPQPKPSSDPFDFQEGTRRMRRWLNGETVASIPLAAELQRWADYISPETAVGYPESRDK